MILEKYYKNLKYNKILKTDSYFKWINKSRILYRKKINHKIIKSNIKLFNK